MHHTSTRGLHLLATTLGLLVLAFACSASPRWRTLQAPHCLVLSQRSEEDTRIWVTQFEQFLAAVGRILAVDHSTLPPLTMVLFAQPRDFAPYYRLDTTGKPSPSRGYFGTLDTWSVIGLAGSVDDEATRRIIFHEATHWIATGAPTEVPLWLNEGLAETFSTFRPGTTDGVFGLSHYGQAEWLQSHPMPSLRGLVETNASDPRYTDPRHNPSFYAGVWLFTHHLLFADADAGTQALARHDKLRRSGASPIEAFSKVFGSDHAEQEHELAVYLRSGDFMRRSVPLPPMPRVSARFEPAPRELVETTLARLAFVAGRHGLAREHIGRARKAAPQCPTPWELLALADAQSGNTAKAADVARQAIALGSKDAWMHIIIGNSEAREQMTSGLIGLDLRTTAQHFALAARLQPSLRSAYVGFAALAGGLQDAGPDDLTLLRAGCERYPDIPELRLGVAALLSTLQRPEEALQVVESLLARGPTIPPEVVTAAGRIQSGVQFAAQESKIRRLIENSRLAEASEELEDWERSRPSAPLGHNFAQTVRFLRADIARERCIEADRDGRPEEGIRILEEQLAATDLPASLRNLFERMRLSLQQREAEIRLKQELQNLEELLMDGRRNREAYTLGEKILAMRPPQKLREKLEQKLPSLRFSALMEEAWGLANTDRARDAVLLLEKHEFDADITEEQRAGLQTNLQHFRQRQR